MPPTVGPITTPLEPVQINTIVNISASFTDPGTPDTHAAVWDWGDNTTADKDGTVDESGGSGTASGSHTYTEVGIYTITLTVTDDDGGIGTSEFQYIVVYDPEGGFVTGGGWIDSPAGAYVPNASLEGKANFGFVSKYKKGATVPTGNTEFNFSTPDMNFHSSTYDWLVIAGARAKFKGLGTINGDGEFGFMLTAIDGQVSGGGDIDKFRIKIWDKATDGIVYDNQLDDDDDAGLSTEIGGGSIVIHSKKKAPTAELASLPDDTRSLPAFPNPANPEIWIPYHLGADSAVAIRIYGAAGRLIRTLDLGNQPAGFYDSRSKAAYWDGSNEAGERVASGIYFYSFQAGQFTATRKILISK